MTTLYFVELLKEELIHDSICNTLTLVSNSCCVGLYSDLEDAIIAARGIKVNVEENKTIFKYIYKVPLNTKLNDNSIYAIRDEFFIKRVKNDE